MRRVDLKGQVFVRLKVLRFSHRNRHGQAYWACRCECGTELSVSGQDLKSGHTKSCGCLKREAAAENGRRHSTTHGACGHPLFVIWAGMMARCGNPKHEAYRNYGGRGIRVCKRWHDPWKFFADMGDRPSRYHWVERVNNNKGYSPTNCRWASRRDQMRNRRANRLITFQGQTKPLCQWAEETGINEGAIRDRIDNLKWSVEKALTTPVSKDHRRRGQAALTKRRK